MENRSILIAGALLMAAPVFCQIPAGWTDPRTGAGAEPVWFQLTEDREQVRRMLGKPVQVFESGKDFLAWQYQIDSSNEDYSHYLVFRKSEGKLISITREYDPQRNVDFLFPEPETVACFFPDSNKPKYAVRARRLLGGRVLLAMGTSKPGQTTGQILLIRETELGNFYPWVAAQLK
jgi:hypothetical protein